MIKERPHWADWMLSGYRWWRKHRGGHWERWYIKIIHGDAWFALESCSKGTGFRPACAFGTPLCEDWA